MIAEVIEVRTQVRKKEALPTGELLPLIFGQAPAEKLKKEDESKLALFEKGLQKDIKKDDTIDAAITKMVKMALAAEFGPSLAVAKGAGAMIETISRAIQSDRQLRRQALIIINRYTSHG